MRLKVMQFNILQGGTELNEPLEITANIIARVGADIVAIPEANGSESKLAEMLNFDVHSLEICHCAGNSLAVITRMPIIEKLKAGVLVNLAEDRSAAIFAAQLTPYPYEPYLCRDRTDFDAIACQNSARRRIDQIQDITCLFNEFPDKSMPLFLCGDLNEPSHLDWTERARNLHLNMIVEWPLSKFLKQLGLFDSYRVVHPNELQKPGITWTPILEIPKKFTREEFQAKRDASNDDMPFGDREVLDRLDFIYYKGNDVSVVNSEIVGESETTADIVCTPWPSDHRAIISIFEIS